MKAWQIFVVGIAALITALFLPSYEALLAGLASVVMVAAVVAGFLCRPQKDVFYLRTTLVVPKPDHVLSVEHDRIAVRVELIRLWLLFMPTFGALVFLITTSAKGTTWDFSLLGRFLYTSSYATLIAIRALLVVVIGILSTWVSERWMLRHADACSADSVSMMAGRVLYSFRDLSGGYFGGEGFPFTSIRPPKLAMVVFYRVSRPQLNKIAMACLFHRPVIIGRGLTDLDKATVAARSAKVQSAPQPL